jgi:hypothetical protein
MPEAVVTASRILHGLDGASVLSSKGGADSATSGVHRNERPSRQDVLHTLTSLIREPRREWRRPTSCCAGRQGQIRPRPARTARDSAGAGACEQSRGLLADPRSRSSAMNTTQDSIDHDRESEAATNASDDFVLSWTSSLTNAMRYMLKADLSSQPVTPPTKNHHGLLHADPTTTDERPHIKYDWTIGKRLKFSCTVALRMFL